MAKKIVWSVRASKKFDAIIDYLETDWNDNVVRAFVQKTESVLDLLAKNPKLGTVENATKAIYGISLTKHNRMFYRIEKDKVLVLNMFDNRQHPKGKKY
ncbi:MAG: type II toxin-antitoxin system RelE/ParE family toxin [Flavobacteriales bacterium]|nr:type II toxin-antitoxin system RelE/ParE family toxin [Flavobacteriales bacterium]